MIRTDNPAPLPKANALDPRRDSVAEEEILNPAPVAQEEVVVLAQMDSIVCSGCHQPIGPRHIHGEHLQETNFDHAVASLRAEVERWKRDYALADKSAHEHAREIDGLRKLLAESEAKLVEARKESGTYSTESTIAQILAAVDGALRESEAAARDVVTKMFLDAWDRPPAPRWPAKLRADIRGLIIGAMRYRRAEPPPSDAEHRLRLILDFVELVGKR